MGNFFGDLDLSYKFAIILGASIVFVFLAGFTKLFITRRRLKINQKKEDIERAGRADDLRGLNQRDLDEGDLFGVRAIEKGYFGGVSQSRPTSAATSVANSPILSPTSSTIIDKTGSPLLLPISGSDFREFSLLRDSSDSSTSKGTKKHIPSPINSRLRPSDAELNGRRNHDPAVNMSSYMPPSPRNFGPSTPTSPGSPAHDRSSRESSGHGPKLLLPSDIRGHPIRFSQSPAAEVSSQAGSIFNGEPSAAPTIEAPRSQGFSIFPSMHSQTTRRSQHFLLPSESNDQSRSRQEIIPPLPSHSQLSQGTAAVELRAMSPFTPWGENVIQEFGARSQSGSKDQITDDASKNEGDEKSQRGHSTAMSSVYSISSVSATSAEEQHRKRVARNARSRSRSQESSKHVRHRSVDSSSAQSLARARARDSILISHNRKSSYEASQATSKRRSKSRDTIHYDPTSDHRNVSGSVHGRKIDFDQPRSSPFSPFDDSNVLSQKRATVASSSHSTSSSESSINSTLNPPRVALKRVSRGQVHQPSIGPGGSGGDQDRDRITSDSLQDNIGEFYDTSYQRSVLAQQASLSSGANLSGPAKQPGKGKLTKPNPNAFPSFIAAGPAPSTYVPRGASAGGAPPAARGAVRGQQTIKQKMENSGLQPGARSSRPGHLSFSGSRQSMIGVAIEEMPSPGAPAPARLNDHGRYNQM